MITGTDVKAVNPSVRHSECEFFVELNQDILDGLEMDMNKAQG